MTLRSSPCVQGWHWPQHEQICCLTKCCFACRLSHCNNIKKSKNSIVTSMLSTMFVLSEISSQPHFTISKYSDQPRQKKECHSTLNISIKHWPHFELSLLFPALNSFDSFITGQSAIRRGMGCFLVLKMLYGFVYKICICKNK